MPEAEAAASRPGTRADLAAKARRGRLDALYAARRSRANVFFDPEQGRQPGRHSVLLELSAIAIRPRRGAPGLVL